VKLAYCSQLLCGVPYEVARSSGLFKNHGLDVELVYTRRSGRRQGRTGDPTPLVGSSIGCGFL
jgi:hypothetical protein